MCFSILPRALSDFLDTNTTKTNHPSYPDPGGLLPPATGLDTRPRRGPRPKSRHGPDGPGPRHSPPPRRPGTDPRPAGLTLSWSHRTLLRFSSGARFRSRPINSSNNCAAEIMVLFSGGCSHQPWHPPKKTPATHSPTSSARSQAEKPPPKRSR